MSLFISEFKSCLKTNGITNLKYCVELPVIFTSSFMLNVLLSNILVVLQ